MTAKLFDMARTFVTGVPGQGPVGVGAAVPDYQTFAAAGAADGDTLTYRITDGNDWEVGTGTYSAAGPSISRGPLYSSAPENVAIQVTSQAQVFSTALASSFADAGTPLTVLGGGGTVTNAATINFTSGGTVSSGGAGVANVAVSGGGGGGSYIETESGGSTKISQMPTLANPPPAPFYVTGITNDGTTQANYQVNHGTIEQPSVTGYNGIEIQIYSGTLTSSGTLATAYGASVNIVGSGVNLTDAAGHGIAGPAFMRSGSAYGLGDLEEAQGAAFYAYGGSLNGTAIQGATALVRGGNIDGSGSGTAGNVQIYGGGGFGAGLVGGDVLVKPGTGYGSNGLLIITNLGTVDPHVLGAAWLGISNGITLSAG